jgi:hypothetical protein
MYRKKSRIAPLLVCLSLATGGFVWQSEAAPTAAQQYKKPKPYKPPSGRGIPSRREGAGTRGPCLTPQGSLMSLVPEDAYGMTVSQQPTFFWYIPPKSIEASPKAAKTASFRLLDEQENEVYTNDNIPLSGFSGIVSYTLPASVRLEVGQAYIWQFSVVCNPDAPSNNPFVEGVIQRVEANQPLNQRLSSSSLRDRPSIYASAGIWYDSLTSLANLRCNNPGDIALTMGWSSLLRSVELADFAREPLSQYCTQIGIGQPNSPRAGVNSEKP